MSALLSEGALDVNVSAVVPESEGICASSFDDEQTRTLRLVTLSGAGLSVAGCVFIIASYVLLVRIRTFPYKLVMFLSLSNLGSSLAYFVGMAAINSDKVCNSTFGCMLAAVMTQFFDVASFFWIAVIAFNVYQVLARERGRAVESNERRYHAFAWGVSLLLTSVVGVAGAFGDAGIWCWIRRDAQALRFLCYYLPLLFVFIYTCIAYVLIGKAVSDSVYRTTVTVRLRLYVLVFVCIRVWSVLHRAQNYLSDTPLYGLALMHSLFSPLQGFANALVYGCNKQVAGQYRRLCARASRGDHRGSRDDGISANSPSVISARGVDAGVDSQGSGLQASPMTPPDQGRFAQRPLGSDNELEPIAIT